MNTEIRIQAEDFSVEQEWQRLRARCDGRVGAVSLFIGLVRDIAGDSTVSELRLEHYPGMTERSIGEIIQVANDRWPLQDVLVVHRVGTLKPLDQIVLVQVAASHRAEAFAGCELIMDYLKTDAVLWKQESRGHDKTWLRATQVDDLRRQDWDETGPKVDPNSA